MVRRFSAATDFLLPIAVRARGEAVAGPTVAPRSDAAPALRNTGRVDHVALLVGASPLEQAFGIGHPAGVENHVGSTHPVRCKCSTTTASGTRVSRTRGRDGRIRTSGEPPCRTRLRQG